MAPCLSWTLLSNLRLMVLCPLLYTGNPHIQTSIYSGTVTITSQPSLSVIQTLSHRASTVCSDPELLQKEKEHLRKALPKCNYPKWALDKVEKRLNRSTRQVNDGGNNSAQTANQECKVRVILSFPTHKVFVKVSKRSVVGMASKLTSRVAQPSKTFWSPPRTKTLWSTKVVPSIGTNV